MLAFSFFRDSKANHMYCLTKLVLSKNLLSFRLFEGSSPKKIEKLKTLLCYFRRVTQTSKY